MATTFSPQPSFYLCPDFSIAPPPNGHLQLGSMLRGLDFDSVFSPLDFGDTADVPDSQLRPLDKPSEKRGFSRSLRELRGLEGSIWGKVFGSEGLGAKFSLLRSRENDETLTVDKLFVRYFIPTLEYIKNALEIDGVAFHINNTKRKKPVYMITRLMWTEGAKYGAKYQDKGPGGWSFEGSSPFILGIRV
ncbi:hypothetical protein GGI43DRAFT_400896 [Trichoderma evansii]